MSVHEGHRARMKQRFLSHGERVFDDHQLLELLLFYAVPQGDTNPLAHRLLQTFGSLAGVFDAPTKDLLRVPGVGEHTALLIHMMPQLMRRYHISRLDEEAIINSSGDAGSYLLPYFYGAKNDTVYLLSMDVKGRVLGCDLIAEGGMDAVVLNSRLVVEKALSHQASQVILAHNHVRGIALPSDEDVTATLALRPILGALGVQLSDHLIIADEDYVSLSESGLLPE